jgi:hypothetical protein
VIVAVLSILSHVDSRARLDGVVDVFIKSGVVGTRLVRPRPDKVIDQGERTIIER